MANRFSRELLESLIAALEEDYFVELNEARELIDNEDDLFLVLKEDKVIPKIRGLSRDSMSELGTLLSDTAQGCLKKLVVYSFVDIDNEIVLEFSLPVKMGLTLSRDYRPELLLFTGHIDVYRFSDFEDILTHVQGLVESAKEIENTLTGLNNLCLYSVNNVYESIPMW